MANKNADLAMHEAAERIAQQAGFEGAHDIPRPGVQIDVAPLAPDFDEWKDIICIMPDKGPAEVKGVLTPEMAKMQQNTAVVLATCDPKVCAVGDRVLVTKVFPLMVDGKMVFVTRVQDVIAVKRKPAPESLRLAE